MTRFGVFVILSFVFSLISCAEDDAKKDLKPKEEKVKEEKPKEEKAFKSDNPAKIEDNKPKEEKSTSEKPKVEVKDIDIEGLVIKRELKNNKIAYYIKTHDKFLVRIPEKIGDKDVNLEQYIDKNVLLKGKGEINIFQSNQKEVKSYKLHHALSIAVQNPSTSEKPATDLKKNEEIKSDVKKAEDKKSEK